MNTGSKNLTGTQLIRSLLLFFGSFMFAFILNSYIIHEAGHAFGGMLFGCKNKSLIINPFGTGSWDSQCPFMTLKGKVVQGMGGPIFGLPISIAITLLLWRKRRPVLLPLLMSAPVVCIANFLGVLDSMLNYPGHIFDYGWMLLIGVTPFFVRVIGIISLVIGIILMNLLLPLAGIEITEPFWKVLLLNLSTWPLYLLIRLFYQVSEGVDSAGPMSFFILGGILAIFTALPFRPILKFASRFTKTEPVIPSTRVAWLVFGLGMGLTVGLTLLNPF
jgi:hypothetical protein